MAILEREELRVVVPVGFALAEAQEVTVSVDRPGQAPLPVRLRLVPARPREAAPATAAPALILDWPARARVTDDGHDLGGGD